MLPFRRVEAAANLNWNALYTDHVGRIYNYFRYRVADTALAEDLTATTFEKAWSKRAQFRGSIENFTAWLFTIARNVANDYFRKSPSLVALDKVTHLTDPQNTADQVEQKIEFSRLVVAVNSLPRRERDLIALKYGADLNNRQIARQLHLSESNVGTILSRTIQKLRQELEVYDE